MDSDSDSGQDSEIERRKIKQERSQDDIEDIFGKMSDDEEEPSERPSGAKPERPAQDSDREEREISSQQQEEDRIREMFNQFDEDEDEQVPETETRIDITIPKINVDLGKESHFVKLPNFLSVDTHPYDPSWYEDEIDEDETCDDEGRARMKLKVENTIRWRNVSDADGNMSKESNARIIKWSDGSMSLHLGSEIFDIHKQQLLSGDNNHLYIRQGIGLQGQTVFKTKLTFRPHSTDSFTHKKMTLSLADRSQKTLKIRVLPNVGEDPEANRTDRIKKEEDKLRASLRRENKARRVRERVNLRGPTASFLEPDMEDDDENAISLSAIKNKYKRGGSSYTDVYSDSESSKSSNDSIFNKKKATTTKKTRRIEESDDE